jgi:hypothetical protein
MFPRRSVPAFPADETSLQQAYNGDVDNNEVEESDTEEDLLSEEEFSDSDDDSENTDSLYAVETILRLKLGLALELNKDRLYQLLLNNLQYVLPTTDSSVSSHAGASNASGSGSASKQPGKEDQQPSRKKSMSQSRMHRVDRNDGDEGDNGEEDGDKQLRQPPAPGVSPTGPKFACPFFKNNPTKYQTWRSCPGPGWDEVHRVKCVPAYDAFAVVPTSIEY